MLDLVKINWIGAADENGEPIPELTGPPIDVEIEGPGHMKVEAKIVVLSSYKIYGVIYEIMVFGKLFHRLKRIEEPYSVCPLHDGLWCPTVDLVFEGWVNEPNVVTVYEQES